MATISLRGEAIETNGALPKVGDQAPDFLLVDAKLCDRTLADYVGKKKIISIVPSLDTPVCAESTKRFNDFAADRNDFVMLVVSADLPFAQGRFCGKEKLKSVVTLSMMRSRRFAKAYGVLMLDGPLAGLTARAVVVLDENDTVLYTELSADLTREPDYASAVAALQ